MPLDGYEPFAPFPGWQSVTVGAAWADYLLALDAVRQSAEPAHLDRARNIALRSAALETGALEGLYSTSRGVTRTVALQAVMWEAELEKLSADVRGHFEAQLSAFDLVLDAATENLQISEAWLRGLHAKVCGAQTTYKVLTDAGWQERALPHGGYKTFPNNVTLADGTTHWYAPVPEVSAEIRRLMEEMRTEAFLAAHPVIQAAFAHHALTAVHPFADGNGRTARALASVFVYRAAGIPLLIFLDQQERYWDALAAADQARPQPFVTFIDERALDAMALVADRLREAQSPLDEQAARIQDLLRAHGGLTYAEVQAVGQRLSEQIFTTLPEAARELALWPDLQIEIEPKQGQLQCTFWDQPYHTLTSGGAFTLHLSCRDPEAAAQATPFVGIANDVTNPFAFIVINANRGATRPLRLRVSDLHPSITAAAELLIEGWERNVLRQVSNPVESEH